MKKKLIPKHQVGKKILKLIESFGNALIAGDSGIGTSMAIASGYLYNPKTRKYELSEENLKEAEELRDNLSDLSTFSPTHPYNVALKGLGYLFKWRPFLPKGSETTVYRQGGIDMVDDALNTGVIKPQSLANYTAKIAADKASGKTIILRKLFPNVMFNRRYPFYGNPGLFLKTGNKGVFIGDMNKSSAQWIQNFHKGHKNIFEPFINGVRQAPVSEFDIYTRAPLNFGWFKNTHILPKDFPFGIIPQTILKTDKYLKGYPIVTIKEEPWAEIYFKRNPNVSGMAIGGGMNGIQGQRRVILNPFTSYNKEAVLLNERLRHWMDESNFKLPNVSKLQLNKYIGTLYENDTLNIGRTEAARYLTGDKHLLNKEQMNYIDSLNIPIFKQGGIHIKKSHLGLFTKYCNGKVTQECIDKAKRSGNKKLVKRAVFAENARKWAKKHDGGGTIKEWYSQKLYNYVDPTGNYPSNMAKAIGLGLFTLFNGENQTYQVTDSVADAAWRKRLGLEYDSKFLPENKDGSVRLPKNLEKEIPVDTTFIKNRIQKNKKLRDYYVNDLGRSESNDLIQVIDIANEIDQETLDSLRHTYKTGDWVVINEHGNNSRQLIEADDYKLSNSPLNVLHSYGIRYNKDNNTIEYKDTYNFNQYEWGVPGKPFDIKGTIKLKNDTRRNNTNRQKK